MIISIIVPCYNEDKTIPVFFREIRKIADTELSDAGLELIFIDDGSEDGTYKIIKNLSETNSNVYYISFSRNFGKEAAIYAGLKNSAGDLVAIMDADLQDPPALLPKMIDLIHQGYDSVATRRVSRIGEPVIRSFFARQFYKIINRISDVDIVDGARDFRMMKRPMADAVVGLAEHNRFSKGIFGWVGFKTCWLEYENKERVAGETKWSFWKLLKYGIEGVISFSNVPLNFIIWMGILMLGAGVLILLFPICHMLLGSPVDLGISLIGIAFILGGTQLLCLGIIGQYLAQTHEETKGRPHYIIAEQKIR